MYKIGRQYKILSFDAKCSVSFKRRLLSMGFVPGAIFDVHRIAPFGDPVEIKIKGYSIALRREELAYLKASMLEVAAL